MKRWNLLTKIILIVCIILTTTYVPYVWADSVENLRQEQEDAAREAEELEAAKKKMQETLGDLNSDLQIVSAKITKLEDEIAEGEALIATAKEDLAQAEKTAEQQYSDMKLRIQFMYENSSSPFLSVLLSSDDFADFLNNVTYINELSNYDREKMDDYEQTMEDIAQYKSTLEEKQAQLLASQEELEAEQTKLLASIKVAEKNIADTEAEIKAHQDKVAELSDEIAALEEYERKLREQKAREEAERIAREKELQAQAAKEQEAQSQKPSSSGGGTTATEVSASEEELLAALIYCEAGGESYVTQVAVGSVVINRIQSDHYPNTLSGVIYQSGQFTPARSGKLAFVLENGLTTDSCRKAAAQVLAGNTSGSWYHFCYNTGTIDGQVIGSEVFY